MNGFRGRSTTSEETADAGAPWKNIGTSMNAISFGFIATAILISMFLIMAIFEYLLRQWPSLLLSRDDDQMHPRSNTQQARLHSKGKLQNVETQCPSDVSILMPGQEYPTYIATPAPLPCPREKMHWAYHDSHYRFPQS